jgi:hypothetical protein
VGFILDRMTKQCNLFLTSHVYATTSLLNKATSLQKLMDGNALNKESKCSWIKVGKKIHTFVLRNNSTLKIVKMHLELNNLNETWKRQDMFLIFVARCMMLMCTKRKKLFHCHNEKLAIVYGFINIPIDSVIDIWKNI